jgi:hypothetical protein
MCVCKADLVYHTHHLRDQPFTPDAGHRTSMQGLTRSVVNKGKTSNI